ncbi:hypothetical protein [Bradyrhizobium sp. LTSPM299]|uniref:hypothetical protein n=1 Tax=Bradyrhizobium sp. LTSPM299 TaxID=1619233 RepID=UPI000678D8CF|nr:hypothetical protein [Bradyrhizobium sp. LTSPM299]
MFGITNPSQLYAKLVLEFDDFCADQGSGRHAMNFVITAFHLTEWVWKDFLKEDEAKRNELGIAKDINAFHRWIMDKSIWTAQMQDLANGSKHFQPKGLPIRQHVVGPLNTAAFNTIGFNEVEVTLVVDMGELEGRPHFIPAAQLFEVVMRFWRDFLCLHAPYGGLVYKGKVKLSDE